MAVKAEEILNLINTAFPNAEVELKDLVGDQDHYELSIKSEIFNDKSKIMQHKMVMQALGGIVGTKLHALSIKTFAEN